MIQYNLDDIELSNTMDFRYYGYDLFKRNLIWSVSQGSQALTSFLIVVGTEVKNVEIPFIGESLNQYINRMYPSLMIVNAAQDPARLSSLVTQHLNTAYSYTQTLYNSYLTNADKEYIINAYSQSVKDYLGSGVYYVPTIDEASFSTLERLNLYVNNQSNPSDKRAVAKQIMEELQRGDLSEAKAESFLANIAGITLSDVEIASEPIKPVTNEYWILTPHGENEDVNGSIIKKIRTLTIGFLTDDQVDTLRDNRYVVEPISTTWNDLISGIDDPIRDKAGNMLNDSPITIESDGMVHMTNEGIFGEHFRPMEREVDLSEEVIFNDTPVGVDQNSAMGQGLGILALFLMAKGGS